MLVLYHQFRTFLEAPMFGGYGPMIALICYALITIIISERYRVSLIRDNKMTQDAAINRSAWPAGFFILLGLLSCWFWITHP